MNDPAASGGVSSFVLGRHSVLDTESRIVFWIPAFAGMTNSPRAAGNITRRDSTFEEKQTDVNIAIKLFQSAINNDFDIAIIVSGDSDLIPTIEAVKATFPAKQIGLVVPIGRRAKELTSVCDFRIKMKEIHLKTSQFPDTIVLDPAKNIALQRPPSWR